MSFKGRQLTLFCLLTISLAGCGGGSNTTPAGTNQTRRYGPLEFALTTTKATFAQSERVPLNFTVTNTSSQTVTAIGGGCLALFRVIQGNQEITPSRGCAAAGYTLTFAPGESKNLTTTWDQKDNNGNPVGAGEDTIKVWLTALTVNGTPLSGFEPEDNLSAKPIQVTVTP